MIIEDLTTTMPDGIKVDEFLAEIERTVVIKLPVLEKLLLIR
jgi:hypothetical protein